MSKEKAARPFTTDIGDYLSREQKLNIIRKARSINGVKWTELHPDEHGDWINHRNGNSRNSFRSGIRMIRKYTDRVCAVVFQRTQDAAGLLVLQIPHRQSLKQTSRKR